MPAVPDNIYVQKYSFAIYFRVMTHDLCGKSTVFYLKRQEISSFLRKGNRKFGGNGQKRMKKFGGNRQNSEKNLVEIYF